MIKKIKTINSITNTEAITQVGDNFIVPSINGTLFILSKNDLKIIHELKANLKINASKVIFKNVVIFRDDNSSKPYLFNTTNNLFDIPTVMLKEGMQIPHNFNISGNVGICYMQKDYSDKPIFNVFDYNTNEILWSINSRQINLFGKHVFSSSKNILSRYDKFSGELLWETEFSQFSDINRISNTRYLGCFKQFIALTTDDRNLIGMNIETGKIVWHVTKFNTNRYQLDKNYGKLKGLVSHSYFEIDMITGEKKRRDLVSNEQYIKNQLKSYGEPQIDSSRDNFVLIGDQIITTDFKKGLFGAFNTNSLKFDWWYEEPGVKFPAPKPIKYFEPFLFLMDNESTLHIYKIA